MKKALASLIALFCVGGISPSSTMLSYGAQTVHFSRSFVLKGAVAPDSKLVIPGVVINGMLKVKITALPAPTSSKRFYTPYDCVRFDVNFMGQTYETRILAPSGSDRTHCPDAPSSQTFDFSRLLKPGQKTPVRVVISDAKTDGLCKLWKDCFWESFSSTGRCSRFTEEDYAQFCPLDSVHKNHSVSGRVEIKTNVLR